MKRYNMMYKAIEWPDYKFFEPVQDDHGEWVKAEVALKMCNSLITIMTLSLWGADLVRSMKEIHDISVEALENAE